MVEIATQIADSDEVRDVVTGLEQQYDAFHRSEEDGRPLPLADEPTCPPVRSSAPSSSGSSPASTDPTRTE